MLTVKFYKPEASVQWIVKQFETIRYDGLNTILTDKFIPRPDVAIVFHFKNIPKIIAPFALPLQMFFVAPVVSLPNQLQIEGKLDGFIVICKASVLSRIFKFDMCAKANFINELPSEIFEPLWKNLNNKTSDKERINCFSDFIQKFAPYKYEPDAVDRIYDDIAENILKFSLQDVHEKYFHSLSSLQRNFNKRVGVSMKRLMRISKVNHIIEKMLADNCFNAQKMMFAGNYYDQPHFVRDFKEITGESPKKFFLHNTELCRILSGMIEKEYSSE
jgi:AraC-like DNA-binding protein